MTAYIANIKDERIDRHIIVLSCDNELEKLKKMEKENKVVIYNLKPIEGPKNETDAKKGYSFLHGLF
jgi:hypothetical protein